jgi:hypothetical protein
MRERPGRPALLLPLLLWAQPGAAQACPDAASLTRGLAEPLAAVRFLADDALQGRAAGSFGERCAGDFIAARLESIGLQPGGENGTFFQDVALASRLAHSADGTGRNVLALLTGADARLRDEIIVIGAHYDHLGLGGAGSMAPGETAVHNGADDNASGVAALLHVAAELATGPRPARSVLFIAFTGEESGLLGSAHFTRNPTVPLSAIKAMINLDMVGRLEDDPLIVYGVDTAAEWRSLLEAAAQTVAVPLALRPEGYGPSDHTSFYTSDIPVLHFFTNTHADYHRPSDDWTLIDAVGLEKVALMVSHITRAVAGPAAAVTLQRGAGEPPRPSMGGSGAYLGTVPDFTPIEHGVLLGGVTPGSPADRAGLRKGDVLVELAGTAVPDLEAFTAALRLHAPGDEIELAVIRDGRTLRVRAVLGSRGG